MTEQEEKRIKRKPLWILTSVIILLILGIIFIVSPKTLEEPNIIEQTYTEYIDIFVPEDYSYKDIKGKIFSLAYGKSMILMSDDLKEVEVHNFDGNKIILSVPDTRSISFINCPNLKTIIVDNENQKNEISVEFYNSNLDIEKLHSYEIKTKK